ncbi:MAG: MarR family transcriptional regulator, partial [Paracoccaceae bacterium]
MTDTDDTSKEIFGFFTEIGIINQLSTALLAQALPDGVHPSHFAILNHLTLRGDGKAPVKIASAMQVTKNTMTHSLKVLEERGYIDVKPDPKDGRAKLVYLTSKGQQFREGAIQ